jgi:hypothetical protein
MVADRHGLILENRREGRSVNSKVLAIPVSRIENLMRSAYPTNGASFLIFRK